MWASPSTAAEPVPETRITDVFNIAARGMYPYGKFDFQFLVTDPAILETESMVAAGFSVHRNRHGTIDDYWQSVLFWDKDGTGGSTSRVLPDTNFTARFGSVAHKSRIFLNTGSGYQVVDRDPAVPVKSFGLGGGDLLGAITDRHVILHTRDAYSYGTNLKFLDANSFAVAGIVTPKFRTARIAATESEVFLASEAAGKVKLYRMEYPDFSQGAAVKPKLRSIPGTYSWIEHFSAEYAVMTDMQGQEIIIRWSDPANGGKAGLYRPPADERHRWFQTGSRLGVISTFPELSISHVTLGSGTYTFEPAGVPRGFRGSSIHSIGPDAVFLTAPTSNLIFGSPRGWTTRVRLAPGRQLFVHPAVADERDGEMRFRVSLDRPSATAVSFDYQTAGRSAVSNEDFTATMGTATLAAGETEVTLTIPLIEDQTIERPETLELQITGVSGAFCDNLRTPGRIRGSGMRVLEEVETDDGSVLPTLDSSLDRTTGVHTLELPGGAVVARDHGFEYFIPITHNGGSYYYARGHRLDSDVIVLCQFDPARGELTEVFGNEEARKREGDEFILKKGGGYVRYGFFNGMPVLSLEGVEALEGGGPQTLTVRSERTRADLDFFAEWADPPEASGPVSFSRQPSGDIALHINPPDDGAGTFDLKPVISATVSASGSATGSTMRTSVTLADADAVATTRVATATLNADGLAADGDRLWLAERGTPLLESLKFENGTLLPAGTARLPAGSRLDWRSYYGTGFSGQGIAFDGERVLSSYWITVANQGTTVVTNASSAKPAVRLVKTGGYASSHLFLPGYLAVSYNEPTLLQDGAVYILDSRTNRVLRILRAPAPDLSFGHALAFSGNTLWVAAPRAGGGKVYGFSVPDFTLTTTLASPEPVPNGTFGYSIAGSAEHLIIGEPSTRAVGAAWVYSPEGGSLLKRLHSGAKHGSDGFGGRVAARGGRLMVASARVSSELDGLATTPQDRPVGEFLPYVPDGTHAPVLLWEDLDSPAVQLKPACRGLPDHASGWGIVLLDDCAVFPSRSPDGGGLEFYEFGAEPD